MSANTVGNAGKPLLFFVHGPPAAGKLTLAKLVHQACSPEELSLFHNHLVVDLCLSLFAFGTPNFVELRERIWDDCFREAVKARRNLLFTFNPERTVNGTFVERVLETWEGVGGGEVVFVELKCADSTVTNRIDLPSRQGGKLSSKSFYLQLREQGAFDYVALPPADLVLDTGSTCLRKTAPALLEFVRSRLELSGSSGTAVDDSAAKRACSCSDCEPPLLA